MRLLPVPLIVLLLVVVAIPDRCPTAVVMTRDRFVPRLPARSRREQPQPGVIRMVLDPFAEHVPVSYTHLRAHETPEHLVCRLLLEKKKKKKKKNGHNKY